MLLRIFLCITFCLMGMYAFSMAAEEKKDDLIGIHQDPSFFRFQMLSGRYFYFLGVAHGIPYEQLLSVRTRQEIDRLYAEGATLYLEHNITNEHYLNFLKGYQFVERTDKESFFRASKMTEEIETLTELEGDSKKIFATLGQRSRVDIDTIARIKYKDLWLISLMLLTHYNLLLRHLLPIQDIEESLCDMFGVGRTRYLETHQDLIRIYQGNAEFEPDFSHEEINAKDKIVRLVQLDDLTSDEIGAIIHEDNKTILPYVSWEMIHNLDQCNKSLYDRNRLWCDAIIRDSSEETHMPFLIVVGNLHFSNWEKGGLINLLRQSIAASITHLERFTAEGWIPVEETH